MTTVLRGFRLQSQLNKRVIALEARLMKTQRHTLDTSTDKKMKYKANYKHLMNAEFMLMPV